MRKFKFLFTVVTIVLCLSSCKTIEEAAANEKAEKEAMRKSYIGWVDASTKAVSVNNGILQLSVKPNLGSYNISVQNEKGKFVPVLSTVDEFSTTAFYLKTSKKTYRLISENNIKTEISKLDDGVKITYTITNVAEVTVNLKFLKSDVKSDFDIIETSVKITNKGSKKETFALKQILDTVLGETGPYHFYTSENTAVKNELMYRNVKDSKWIISKNNSAEMQMIFTGADAKEPELLALANYSTLSKSSWEPDMLSFRTFDTVLSYNNSAVGVIWPSVKLMSEEASEIVYYMAFGVDGEKANGETFLLGRQSNKKSETVSSVEDDKNSIAEEPVVPVSVEDVPVEKQSDYTPKDIPSVEFNVNSNLSKEQYSPEYIQSLLNRIAALENQPASALNREELLRLNTELDEILSSLR